MYRKKMWNIQGKNNFVLLSTYRNAGETYFWLSFSCPGCMGWLCPDLCYLGGHGESGKGSLLEQRMQLAMSSSKQKGEQNTQLEHSF